MELRSEQKDIHSEQWQIKFCGENTKCKDTKEQGCREQIFKPGLTGKMMFEVKSLGEQAGSSTGFCAEDTTQGPQTVGQPMSGVFMEPKYGCCAYGEVEFEQQVVNNWDEVKESE